MLLFMFYFNLIAFYFENLCEQITEIVNCTFYHSQCMELNFKDFEKHRYISELSLNSQN